MEYEVQLLFRKFNITVLVRISQSFYTSFSEFITLVSCNSEMIFWSFFNVDLSAIIMGVRTNIAIRTPKENKEKINKAKDVLMFQINRLMLTSAVF